MWTTSLASGFSSHSGGPDGSFKNATIDWTRKKKKQSQNDKSATACQQSQQFKSCNNFSLQQNNPMGVKKQHKKKEWWLFTLPKSLLNLVEATL